MAQKNNLVLALMCWGGAYFHISIITDCLKCAVVALPPLHVVVAVATVAFLVLAVLTGALGLACILGIRSVVVAEDTAAAVVARGKELDWDPEMGAKIDGTTTGTNIALAQVLGNKNTYMIFSLIFAFICWGSAYFSAICITEILNRAGVIGLGLDAFYVVFSIFMAIIFISCGVASVEVMVTRMI